MKIQKDRKKNQTSNMKLQILTFYDLNPFFIFEKTLLFEEANQTLVGLLNSACG